MNIEIIGGGPGGLYLAILAKKARPDWHVAVHEQNQPNDTFGFGVVFSDDTLDEFLSRDPQSYVMIRDRFAYWDDIIVRYKGEDIRCGGNGFAGCARLALLQVLYERCRQVGVQLNFGEAIDPAALATRFPDADVIVGSDGINSRIRTQYADAFQPDVRLMRNKFTWMGSTRPLTDFTYFFRETPHGVIVAHTYQYEPGRSTWIFEATPECWAAHCFDRMGEDDAARYLEAEFAEELEGHGLITNRSLWRNFPRVECKHWSHGNIVSWATRMRPRITRSARAPSSPWSPRSRSRTRCWRGRTCRARLLPTKPRGARRSRSRNTTRGSASRGSSMSSARGT